MKCWSVSSPCEHKIDRCIHSQGIVHVQTKYMPAPFYCLLGACLYLGSEHQLQGLVGHDLKSLEEEVGLGSHVGVEDNNELPRGYRPPIKLLAI